MSAAHGCFTGEPLTLWLTEAVPDRRMKLIDPFAFTDPRGKDWKVPAGYDQMNGASIPRPLWSLIGTPFTGDYRRASIVHDHACDEAGDDHALRLAADRMFYHACRAGNCKRWQAMLLYIGVRIGAHIKDKPRWLGAVAAEVAGPRLHERPEEPQLRARFRLVVAQVAETWESDDPQDLETLVSPALLVAFG